MKKFCISALASLSFLAPTLFAQIWDPALDTPRLRTEIRVDAYSEYLRHGYALGDTGALVQPSLKLTMENFITGDDFLLSPYVGATSSVRTNRSSGAGPADGVNAARYHLREQDWQFGAELRSPYGVFVTEYQSCAFVSRPFNTIHELSFTLIIDDLFLSRYCSYCGDEGDEQRSDSSWSYQGLRPFIRYLTELQDNAPNVGTGLNGQLIECGFMPGVAFSSGPNSVTLQLPITVGINAHNYYFDKDGDETRAGYLSVGPQIEIPLSSSKRWGTWSLTGGFLFYSIWADSARDSELAGTDDPGDKAYVGRIGVSCRL